jgi:Phosphodiester glycosidase
MLVENDTLEASPVSSWPWDLEILNNGQVQLNTETFTGTADDTTDGTTQPLVAVNRIDQTGLTAVTPFLGAVSIGASTIATATVNGNTLTITGVKTSQTSLARVPDGQEYLIARRGTAASTWLQTATVGHTVTLSESMAPYGIGQVQTGLSGGAYLVQNGQMAVPVQAGGENNVLEPSIGLGVSQDGTHAFMAVLDGRASENQAVGLTRPQFAQWMLAHGAYNAIEFDSGGSAEMVGRLPGQQQMSVLNTRSDGQERPVADGLFVPTRPRRLRRSPPRSTTARRWPWAVRVRPLPLALTLARFGGSGSMDVHYSIPAASGVSQVVFYPTDNVTVGDSASGQAPTAIGLWVKGAGGTGTYEAQMYEQIAATYQATHPQAHVVLLFGHARGFSEQLLRLPRQRRPERPAELRRSRRRRAGLRSGQPGRVLQLRLVPHPAQRGRAVRRAARPRIDRCHRALGVRDQPASRLDRTAERDGDHADRR